MQGNVIQLGKYLQLTGEYCGSHTNEVPWILSLASNCFTTPKNSSCSFLTDIEVDSKSESPVHSIFLQAHFILAAKTEAYSFSSGLMHLESWITLFHYPRKIHFSSITNLQPHIDFAAPLHTVLANQAVSATQSTESAEKAFERRKGAHCYLWRTNGGKEMDLIKWEDKFETSCKGWGGRGVGWRHQKKKHISNTETGEDAQRS